MIANEHAASVRSRNLLGHRTILCVDDEPLASRALYRLLSRDAEYDVLIADSPRQALRYVQDFDVDLVITDQRMPDMSGVELLAEVRKVSPLTAGLLLTAYPESVLVDDPPSPPAPPIFAKPWDDQTLRVGVREMLRARGRKPAAEGGAPSSAAAVRTLLVPVEGSIGPEPALRSVLPLFGGDPLRVLLLQVLPRLGLHRDVYARLERMRRDVSCEGVDAIADIRWGDFAEQMLLHARHADADIVVLPNRDIGGRAGWLRKTASERILDGSELPLLICPAEVPAQRSKRILVPLDGSPEAEAALPEAVRFATHSGARIDLLAVLPRLLPTGYGYIPYPLRVPQRTPYLDEVARDLELTEVEADVHFLEGDPAEGILRFARDSRSDLVCMATQRRSGWRRVIGGGVAREVLRRAPCPVFVGKGHPRVSS